MDWPSTLPPCPILRGVIERMAAVGADHVERMWGVASEWIPIEEQWPQHLSDVLVAYKCGNYVRIGVGEFDGTIEKDGLIVPYFKGIGGFEVTHWMKLPEPPAP